ncbi:unnamed protein product, partial [Scytosiphon promiscuus]
SEGPSAEARAGAGVGTAAVAAPAPRPAFSGLDIGDVDDELYDLVDRKMAGEIGDAEFKAGLHRLLDIKHARSVALSQEEARERCRRTGKDNAGTKNKNATSGRRSSSGSGGQRPDQQPNDKMVILRTSSWAAGTTEATRADRKARSRQV